VRYRARINICRRYYTIVFSPRAHLASRARVRQVLPLYENFSNLANDALLRVCSNRREKLSSPDRRGAYEEGETEKERERKRERERERERERRRARHCARTISAALFYTWPGRVSTFTIYARLSSRFSLINAARFQCRISPTILSSATRSRRKRGREGSREGK